MSRLYKITSEQTGLGRPCKCVLCKYGLHPYGPHAHPKEMVRRRTTNGFPEGQSIGIRPTGIRPTRFSCWRYLGRGPSRLVHRVVLQGPFVLLKVSSPLVRIFLRVTFRRYFLPYTGRYKISSTKSSRQD